MPKLKIQNFKIKKLSDFRRFSIPRSEEKNSKNLQISMLGFQSVIMKIEKVEYRFVLHVWFIARFGYIFLRMIEIFYGG